MSPTLPVWWWPAVGEFSAEVGGDGTLDSINNNAGCRRGGAHGSRREKLDGRESRLDLGGCER